MATSEVEVVNRALDHLNAAPVVDLAADVEEARRMRRAFPIARDAVLRAYPWNCARRRVRLAADATAPVFGYGKQFPLPEGPLPLRCLRVLLVGDTPHHTGWRVEGRYLLTDEGGPLPIEYVGQLTDVAQWDALLVEAIAYRLAADVAWPMTGSESRRAAMMDGYRTALAEARRIDAREQSQDEKVISDTWLTERF
jgi:hypothetical protein